MRRAQFVGLYGPSIFYWQFGFAFIFCVLAMDGRLNLWLDFQSLTGIKIVLFLIVWKLPEFLMKTYANQAAIGKCLKDFLLLFVSSIWSLLSFALFVFLLESWWWLGRVVLAILMLLLSMTGYKILKNKGKRIGLSSRLEKICQKVFSKTQKDIFSSIVVLGRADRFFRSLFLLAGVLPGMGVLIVNKLFLSKLKNNEVEAVLYHEAFHLRKQKSFAVKLAFIFGRKIAVFVVAYLLLTKGTNWGIHGSDMYMSACFYSFCVYVLTELVAIGESYFSRQEETQADLFAATQMGESKSLMRALQKASLFNSEKNKKEFKTRNPFAQTHPSLRNRLQTLREWRQPNI